MQYTSSKLATPLGKFQQTNRSDPKILEIRFVCCKIWDQVNVNAKI